MASVKPESTEFVVVFEAPALPVALSLELEVYVDVCLLTDADNSDLLAWFTPVSTDFVSSLSRRSNIDS